MRFTRSAPLTGGGTVSGNLTITGDLSVTGDSTVTSDELLQGTSTIDVTSTEAFLVRKNSDGGDIFTVDTTNSQITINGSADEKLMIKGSSNPYIALYEGTTRKSWIQWHSDGYMTLENNETGTTLKLADEITTDNPELTDVIKSAVVDKPGVQLGIIAQELEEICSSCVKTQSTGIKTVDTDPLIWHLINAVKELSSEVNALKAK